MNHERNRFIGEILGSRLTENGEIFDRSLERGYRTVHGNCYGIPEEEATARRHAFLNSLPADFLKWERQRRIEKIAGAAYDIGCELAYRRFSMAA